MSSVGLIVTLCRTYVTFDIVQRILADVFGVAVHHIMGMTDVDDKIVKRAAAERISMSDVARFDLLI